MRNHDPISRADLLAAMALAHGTCLDFSKAWCADCGLSVSDCPCIGSVIRGEVLRAPQSPAGSGDLAAPGESVTLAEEDVP